MNSSHKEVVPKFSIIVPHYQGVINHKRFCRGIQSLQDQTFKSFEILCYHDGPLMDARLPFPIQMTPTETRKNDYGHSLRDLGIKDAVGEYIIHFNPDNILYPDALEQIDQIICRTSIIFDETGKCLDTDDIVIFPILMRGVQIAPGRISRFDHDPNLYTIFTGVPVKLYSIDAMQLVMKRERWLEEGGWYDKTHDGDGIMYEKFATKYGYRTVCQVLGEHW
jgi:hypothetical protein